MAVVQVCAASAAEATYLSGAFCIIGLQEGEGALQRILLQQTYRKVRVQAQEV